MSIFQRIDLSQLPAPIVVEQKTYEQILLELKTDLNPIQLENYSFF